MSRSEVPGPADGVSPVFALVVDDDPILRMILRKLLESLGAQVDEAPDGSRALELLRPTTELVLLDVMMPGMTGIEVCKAIRSGATRPEVVVWVVSSATDAATHDEARAAGANGVLTKPVSKEQLDHVVRFVRARRAG